MLWLRQESYGQRTQRSAFLFPVVPLPGGGGTMKEAIVSVWLCSGKPHQGALFNLAFKEDEPKSLLGVLAIHLSRKCLDETPAEHLKSL